MARTAVSRFAHGVLEYVLGVVFVAAPFVIDYDDDAAKVVSVLLGIAVIALAAATEGASGVGEQIGLRAHTVLDVVLAVVMIASPFVFGFSDDGEPTALLIALGAVFLVLGFGTRFFLRLLPKRERGVSR